MKQSKKLKRADSARRPKNSRQAKSTPEKEYESKSGGSFARDLLLGIAVCVLFFALVEGFLRVTGIPARDFSDDPFVGFSGIQPLFAIKDGVASTAPSKLKYFNEASFKVPKPLGTVRVFCFGGSTTYGHPFDGRTAFPRWLQDLLKAASPEKEFEVINVGGISYASYRIVPLIKETLQYQPDLMVIYTGHNEFLERRTYAGLLDQSSVLLMARARLEELNTYRALRVLLQPLLPNGPTKDAGKKEFSGPGHNSDKPVLKEEVSAILDRSAGLEMYHRDEEFAKGVVQHFSHNLRAMMALCTKAGVPVIIVEPASNLKDFSPFKSEHGPNLTASEKKEIRKLLDSAMRLLEGEKSQEALKVAQDATRKDPLFAESHYCEGRALIGTGRDSEAKTSFAKAKDLDVCPLRCISALEAQIATIVKEEDALLIPYREALERNASEGIPGNESFLDHLHPTIEKHQLLAEMIFDKIQANGPVRLARSLSSEERSVLFKQGVDSLDSGFFGLRDLNLAKTLRWAGKKDEARFALEKAAKLLPDNVEIHKMLGSYLLEDGNYEKAIEEYKAAVLLSGHDPELIFSMAMAYYRSGRKADAVSSYLKLTRQEQPIPEAFGNLAMIYLEEGKIQEALELLETGLKGGSDTSALYSPYGLCLAMSGRIPEAISWMVRAVNAEPGNPGHFYNLAGMYALSGNKSEALHQLDLAVQKGYSDGDKLARDRVFDPIRNLPEFKKILHKIQ
ncbi:MAG: tetratricopeptide repeat protein [Desulfomonile tiedjei]|uniref:Tetratricopeptide repeat protein n=1 Tax=Desulfomonile tiedjei TaxID=2358 RepID=A0A9D6V559_9BACT|nr:tetratricopeptide repeat protein [Desulfomonile tiedjei]